MERGLWIRRGRLGGRRDGPARPSSAQSGPRSSGSEARSRKDLGALVSEKELTNSVHPISRDLGDWRIEDVGS